MGMDVIGKNPSDERGAYFRASVWSWPPILCLMEEANERFGLGLDFEDFEFNQGAGLRSRAACNRLADALAVLLREFTGHLISLDRDPQGPEARVLEMLEAFGWSTRTSPTLEGACAVAPMTYSAEREHVMDFVEFLRSCGGFEIW